MRRETIRVAALEANVHEHIARTMYYFSVHLLFASLVASAAWVLTYIRSGSATAKYWIWVVTAFNFVVPAAAITDKVWAQHFKWAAPLAAIGGPVWDVTQGRTAVVLATVLDGWRTCHAYAIDLTYTERAWRGSRPPRKAEQPSCDV